MIKELKAYIDAKVQSVLKTGIKERSFARIDNVDYDTKTLTVSSWSDGLLQKILLTAKKEIGIREILGIKHNKRILEYHQATSLKASEDEVPWCASFANFILKQCGISGTYSAMARSFLNFGQSIIKNRDFDTMRMRSFLGAILVFKRGNNPIFGHVCFFYSADEKILDMTVKEFKKMYLQLNNYQLYGLGGNQSDSVSIAKFKNSDLLDIRIPI